MRNSLRSVPLAVLTLWLLLFAGPASGAGGPTPAGASPAQVDSLVWYVQQLEYDLKVEGIRAEARQDSLKIRCALLTEQLAWSREDRRRWFHDPRLWFLAGAAAATLVMSGALHLAF